MHELFEELDAFDSRWRTKYATTYDAAVACNCVSLYSQYLNTLVGRTQAATYDVPDYAGAAKRAAESNERFEEASGQ